MPFTGRARVTCLQWWETYQQAGYIAPILKRRGSRLSRNAKMMQGPCAGGAVALSEAQGPLVVCEGSGMRLERIYDGVKNGLRQCERIRELLLAVVVRLLDESLAFHLPRNIKRKSNMTSRGGAREGAGRPAGSANRATADLKARLSELARQHTSTALDTLVDVCGNGLNETARISAARAILDRGFGKPRETEQDQGGTVSLPLDGWSIERAEPAL